MSQDRTVRLLTKVNTELVVELHAAILSVAVDHQHHRAFLKYDSSHDLRTGISTHVTHVGVELLVPGGEQRRGHVQSLPVKTELQHLRSSPDPLVLDVPHAGLDAQLLVLGDGDGAPGLDGAPEEDLASHLGVPGVGDVVLPDISVQPVGEVEILVVHADQDVSHDTGHLGQDPAVHLLVGNLNNLFSCPVSLF